MAEHISHARALAEGLPRFFTGRPCKRGHVSERYTKSKTCVVCGNQRSRDWNQATGYSKQNREQHRDKAKESSRAYRQANKDRVRLYGRCEYARLLATLNQMKRRARDKGIEFSLTCDDLTIPEKCPILGIPLARSGAHKQDNSPSFDRVDNTKGYTKDNVQVISWRANRLKADATLEEVQAIAAYMLQHNKNTNHASSNHFPETPAPTR